MLNFAADKGLIRVESDPNRGLRFYPGADLQQVLEKSKRLAKPRETPAAAPKPPAHTAETDRPRGRRRRRRNGHPPSGPGSTGVASGRAVPAPPPPSSDREAAPAKQPQSEPAPAAQVVERASGAAAEEPKAKRPRRKVGRKAAPRSRKAGDEGPDVPSSNESS